MLYNQVILKSIYFFLAHKASMNYIIFMPTKKPQILLTVNDDLLKSINEYHLKSQNLSRCESIRQLIRAGLKVSGSSKSKKSNK